MRSIRTRMLLWTLGAISILLAGFGIFLYEAISRSLSRNFDEVLASTARTVCGFVEQNAEGFKVEVDELQVPEFRRPVRPEYFQIRRTDGVVLARSPSLQGRDLPSLEGPADQFVFQPVQLPDGRSGRAAGLTFAPKQDEDGTAGGESRRVLLVVARETAALDEEIANLRWLLFAATGGVIAFALVAGSIVVRQGLKPLDRLAAQISAIRDDDLASVSSARMPAEMKPVVARLNDLLRRLAAAFRRERAFSADVAHELRTPLAGMRCTLEVALTRPRQGTEYRQAISECLEIVIRTQRIIDHLLVLARLEEGKTTPTQETADIAAFADAVWRPLANTAADRGITVENRIPAGMLCKADRENLELILSNLFENAAQYTDENGRIFMAAVRDGDSVTLSVSNSGCLLTEADVGHIFERFWRRDTARSETGAHCGLGLVLVQRAAAAIGGSVRADVQGGVFTVSLSLRAESGQNIASAFPEAAPVGKGGRKT